MREAGAYDACPAGSILLDCVDALQAWDGGDVPKVEPAADRAAVRVWVEGAWYQVQVELVPDPGLPLPPTASDVHGHVYVIR